MAEHMERNGLKARIVHAAAWREDTSLRFPVIPPQDHGAAAAEAGGYGDLDYRGLRQQYVDVPGYSLTTICRGMSTVDYMHWDVQGAEMSLAEANPDLLNSRVRFLFIGTHSRAIEGRLLEFFFKHGWNILHEHPCAFDYRKRSPSLEGMTTSDGELFVHNPLLPATSDAAPLP